MIFIVDSSLLLLFGIILLLGGYVVGQTIAEFLISFGFIFFIIIAVVSMIINWFLPYNNRIQKYISIIGYTITDIIKSTMFYIFITIWASDFAYNSSMINNIVGLIILPFVTAVISTVFLAPSFAIKTKLSDDTLFLSDNTIIIFTLFNILLDLLLTILFIISLRTIIIECFSKTYNSMFSNYWWEMFLRIKN